MFAVDKVALCSGGFDSICMMYYLKENFPDDKIQALFFNYGQKALDKERACAEAICAKLGYSLSIIDIPRFSWSHSGLYEDNADVYLELRNLVFLSYAASAAQSLEVEEIYTAFLYPQGYPDTSFEFVEDMNTLLRSVGVKVVAPFHRYEKEDLVYYVRKYNITRADFYSCLETEAVTGVPCANCALLDRLFESEITPNLVEDLYRAGKDYLEVMNSVPITKAKLFVNDVCNMHCDYCLTSAAKPPENLLSETDWFGIIAKLASLGVSEIDFTGKEPLIDERIFRLIAQFKRIGGTVSFSAISNGYNAEKYFSQIVESLNSITFSYDGEKVRSHATVFESDVLEKFCYALPVNISYDLHTGNYQTAIKDLEYLFNSGVSSVYIKPILSYGVKTKYQLSNEQFWEFIGELTTTLPVGYRIHTMLSIPFQYSKIGERLKQDIYSQSVLLSNSYKGVQISYDSYCVSGKDTVFIDCSGRCFGCGECAFRPYNKDVPTVFEALQSRESLKISLKNCGKRACTLLSE